MLAPRKKLWSTPSEVLDKALEVLALGEEDVCFDIGCGDGRFLFKCLDRTPATCVGIEIDEDRFRDLSDRLKQSTHTSRCSVICANALDLDYSTATSFFLYLIPRGLKVVFKEIIRKILNRRLRIVTYMSPFPPEFASPVSVVRVPTATHQDASWPLYYYDLYFDAPAPVSSLTPAPSTLTTEDVVSDRGGAGGSASDGEGVEVGVGDVGGERETGADLTDTT